MAHIVIKCPNTGKPVPTGVDMDKKGFESAQLSGNSFQCPACGNMHTWDKKDAWVQED